MHKLNKDKIINRFLIYPLEAIIVFLTLGIVKILPLNFARKIMGQIFMVVGPLLKKSNIARHNLNLAFPEKTPTEKGLLLRHMWRNLGFVFVEYVNLKQLGSRGYIKVEGLENIDKDKPGLILLSHLANWEICTHLRDHYHVNIIPVYRAPNNQYIHWLVKKIRGKAIAKGASGARAILKALKESAIVVLLNDQRMHDGIKANFFGHPVMTATGIAELALKYNYPIYPIEIVREQNLKSFTIKIGKINIKEIAVSDNHHENVYNLVQYMNELIEGWIRKNPSDWLWIHNRWKP